MVRRVQHRRTISTERGTVEYVIEEAGPAISLRAVRTDVKKPHEALGRVKELMSKFEPMSAFARAYMDGLDAAWIEHGERGICVQIHYFLSNVRAKNPEQKAARKELLRIAKSLAA